MFIVPNQKNARPLLHSFSKNLQQFQRCPRLQLNRHTTSNVDKLYHFIPYLFLIPLIVIIFAMSRDRISASEQTAVFKELKQIVGNEVFL